jgi:hypothetical protein
MRAVLLRKARSWCRQPLFFQLWFLPAWLALGLSTIAIRLLPFRRIVGVLGEQGDIAPWVPLLTPAEEWRAALIGRVVRTAARYSPWGANCFSQALAARLLLGVYGVPFGLYFGVRRQAETPGLAAHAWISAGRSRVTGGTDVDLYTVVGCFMSARPQSEA